MKSVLLVEDDQACADIITIILADLHCNTKHCSTIQAAKKLLENNAFDLIALDISLPDGNGLGLLWSLRDKQNRTKVAIMTGDVTKQAADVLNKNDPDTTFFTKPVGYTDMQRMLQDAVAYGN